MADTKISALTAATTPLAGTEVLPIVQSGVTKQVSVADLTAGRAVSALSLSLTNALTAANGGTGQSSYAVGDLLYASGSTALSKLADVATGNALISGGVGVAPSWGKIGLTTHVSGTLGATNGGTGLSSATTGDILYASGTNTWASLADVATGNTLISGGVNVAPSWGKVGLTTHVSGTLATGNGGTGQSSFTAGDLMYYASGTALTKLGIGAANTVLTSTGSAPQWATSLALGGSLSVASNTLIGTTSTAGITGNGLSVNSGSVGTSGFTAALSLTGSGGDFYAQNWRESTGTCFYDLVVFSSATDQMYRSYRTSGGTVTDCYRVGANGDFEVYGALSKGSGSFRIEHPHPELSPTHELVHSFIEGPQADLIYRGQVQLQNGRAKINIDQAADMRDGTFVLLCRDVQCFTSNETDWDSVRGKVSGNILTIESQNATSNATISWMVVGERQDKHMMNTDWTDDNGKVIVEPLKRPKPKLE